MDAYDIIIRPVVTEKSMDDMAERKYTFRVKKTTISLRLRRLLKRFLA